VILLALAACGDSSSPPPGRAVSVEIAPPRPFDAGTPPIAGWPELAGLVAAQPVWLVDVGPPAPRPEIAAHPPLVLGERVLIAGSRVGHVALDRGRGEVAWRRPGSSQLSAPLVLGRDDVALVHECDQAVGAPPGHAVLACFDRIHPNDVAARAAGRMFIREDSVGDCLVAAGAGPWSLTGDDPRALALARGVCRFAVDLESGAARRLDDAPPPAALTGDDVLRDGDGTWQQVIADGRSTVGRRASPRLPGLTVLAAARFAPRHAGAVVIRADTSLQRDYLAAYDERDIFWVWPLPPPPDGGRGGPVAVATTVDDIYVFFDGHRVARFTAPWARSTAP
jgi:hypothetical protein